MALLDVRADLTFEAFQAGRWRGGASPATTGRVRADGAVIEVTFARSPSLRGTTRSTARRMVDVLDRSGLTLRLIGPRGPVITVGHGVRSPWWQTLATGSRRIRLGSRGAVLDTLRGPDLFAVALPRWLTGPPPARGLRRLVTRPLRSRRTTSSADQMTSSEPKE